jgi:predicted RNA binding protein YcfA (HicA-like mRNA interferase family)
MKLSRSESGSSLIKKLSKLGYEISRQKGSHIRLTRIDTKGTHNITIPNHDPIKIGLLSKILHDVANRLDITKDELLKLIND